SPPITSPSRRCLSWWRIVPCACLSSIGPAPHIVSVERSHLTLVFDDGCGTDTAHRGMHPKTDPKVRTGCRCGSGATRRGASTRWGSVGRAGWGTPADRQHERLLLEE